MSETTEKLVGIKQVLLPEFKAAEEAGTTKGYMWFVRDNNITLHNYIYLGSRLYGEAEIEVPFDSVITNVISDNSIVVTKTSSEEGTTVELKVNLDPNGGLTLTENGLQIDMSQFVSQSELDKVKDDIKTVNDNLVTSINAINQNVADGFNTINGGIENEIKPAIAEAKKLAVDETERALAAETNLQTNINIETTERKIDVSNLQNNINVETERAKAAEAALAEKVKEVDVEEIKNDIKTVNDNLVTAVNAINKNMADGFNTINGGIDNEIKPAIDELKASDAKSVKYQEFDTDRKTIQLANFDTLSGIMTDGEGVNLAMVSKWDKADFGSTKLPFNMNGSEPRPTYNDTKEVALVEDIDGSISSEADRVNAMVDVINESIKTVNDNLVAAVNTINGGIENEIKPAIEAKVSSVELVQDPDNQLHYELMVDNVKKGDINIPKDQFLKDVTYDDTTKENVMDFGSAKYPLNLNTPAGVRVTVQEQGQSGDDANKIAYLSDLDAINTNVSDMDAAYKAADVALDAKISDLDTAYKAADSVLEGKITVLETANSTNTSAITANQTAISDLNTKVSGNTDAIANKVDKVDGMGLSQENFTTAEKTKLAGLSNYDDTAIKASIEENKTNIADVRTDLTNESTLQAQNYATLTNDLGSEVTRATNRENTIETAVNNIINNGLALQNGKSITAYPNPSGSSSPVEILTITSGNVVNVGSNIGILELESKGDIVAILDGNRKTVAIKEDVDALIATLQNTIAALTTRVEALEAKNP